MKRKEITVQSLMVERITYSRSRSASLLPTVCDSCGVPVNWLRLPDLFDRFELDLETLFAAIDNGVLHISLGPRRTLYVCETSAVLCFLEGENKGTGVRRPEPDR